MRVFIKPPPVESWALRRVADALAKYSPHEVVEDQDDADLVVLQVIGRQDRNHARAKRLRDRGQMYAIVQLCLRSTMRPSTEGWVSLWEPAALTWSYYDLRALCAEDGVEGDFRFYHAPLGVDASVFYPRGRLRKYIIATSGLSRLQESVREAEIAAGRVNLPMFHLGPKLHLGPHVTCARGMDDNGLAEILSQCEFVAGLRRTEGFELLAAEGLVCGARPVCFDRPHYRQWFSPWAIFIPEGPREQVVSSLERVFRGGAISVSSEERQAAKVRFDWETIVAEFWRRVCHGP